MAIRTTYQSRCPVGISFPDSGSGRTYSRWDRISFIGFGFAGFDLAMGSDIQCYCGDRRTLTTTQVRETEARSRGLCGLPINRT
jgi:hypothetical protein